MGIEDLSDRFVALSRQERFYQSVDYLKLRKDTCLAVDEHCRFIMTNWCYQVLDYCDASQETGSMAISYVDRFLSSKKGSFVLNDKSHFQLAVMSSLLLAIKIHESSKLETDTLSKLSRGLFSSEDINAMEQSILSALSWRLCPATPYAFLEFFLDLLPPLLPIPTKLSIMKSSQKQITLASTYYSFTMEKASSIAFAALLNAMDENRCSSQDVNALICCADRIGFNCLEHISLDLRRNLCLIMNPGSYKEKLDKTISCSHAKKNSSQQAAVCVRS